MLDALEQALHDRRPVHRGGLVHHSDRGSQGGTSRSSTQPLVEAGVEPSVGSVGDSYDNALAETINGLYKAEIIHRRGPWRSLEAVEFATLNGWTGSTTGGSWSPSATSRRPKPRIIELNDDDLRKDLAVHWLHLAEQAERMDSFARRQTEWAIAQTAAVN